MSEGVERRIGLPGAVFTLVGYVIGASIFILPGQLAADVGPGAFVSYLIAGVLAALGSVVAAQIGSALPVRMSASGPETIVCPTCKPAGAMM